MARRIVLDEFHLTVLAPASLTPREAGAVVRTLKGSAFLKRLKDLTRQIRTKHPSLGPVQFRWSR